jgi:hypothetical protein
MIEIEKVLIEREQKEHGQSMERGFSFAMNLAIGEIKEVRDHWQKRLQPDPHSKKQGLEDDSLVYFEFTKMVLEMLICRFEEAKETNGNNLSRSM